MATFVLVHGALHGAWCWYRVVPRLDRAGHRVIAVDLPGMGRDRTPLSEVTLATWAESVRRVVEAEPEPVVLVGHSRGGIVVSEVAERVPARVKVLVYVTAFLLRDGEALLPTAETDGGSSILPNLIPSADGKTVTVREEAVRRLFYGSSSDEDVTLARLLLGPEPLGPSGTPVRVTAERFGSVKRAYVECLRDRTISIELQRRMVAASPCGKVFTLDTDHSPFFSAPDDLARHLIAVASE